MLGIGPGAQLVELAAPLGGLEIVGRRLLQALVAARRRRRPRG